MKTISATVAALALSTTIASAADLTIEVYNPGTDAIFPVTSSLIYGPTEAILVDAQFDKASALEVLEMVQGTGKDLKAIYISHGDPDFYFGLDVLTAAYPNAQVVATPQTLKHINATQQAKISYWGPILGENAPSKVVIPNEISHDTFTVDGEEVKIVGLDGHNPKHTFLHVPSENTILGGVLLYENLHVWMADAQTLPEQTAWQQSLGVIRGLEADRIIPGHYLGEIDENLASVDHTGEYVAAFGAATAKLEGAEALIEAMSTQYRDFTNTSDLELSAKVLEGEMSWP